MSIGADGAQYGVRIQDRPCQQRIVFVSSSSSSGRRRWTGALCTRRSHRYGGASAVHPPRGARRQGRGRHAHAPRRRAVRGAHAQGHRCARACRAEAAGNTEAEARLPRPARPAAGVPRGASARRGGNDPPPRPVPRPAPPASPLTLRGRKHSKQPSPGAPAALGGSDARGPAWQCSLATESAPRSPRWRWTCSRRWRARCAGAPGRAAARGEGRRVWWDFGRRQPCLRRRA